MGNTWTTHASNAAPRNRFRNRFQAILSARHVLVAGAQHFGGLLAGGSVDSVSEIPSWQVEARSCS